MKIGAMARGTWLVTPDKFLTSDQVQGLRGVMAAHGRNGDRYAVRNAAVIETLIGSGLRVSELCDLVVGDVFLEAGSPSILVRRGKGGKSRLVAISAGLAGYLSKFVAWKEHAGEPIAPASPLFMSERRCALHRSAVHRLWKASLRLAKLSSRHGVHATRHSYAVEVYRRTKDLRLTQRLLGHASPNTTQVYASLLDDDVRRGVEALWMQSP